MASSTQQAILPWPFALADIIAYRDFIARLAGEKLDAPHPVAKTSPAAGGYRSGQLVEVRSLSEILATLDADGTLDGMPFMPEMVRYCGQTLKVFRRAAKTCVEGLGVRGMTGGRPSFCKMFVATVPPTTAANAAV